MDHCLDEILERMLWSTGVLRQIMRDSNWSRMPALCVLWVVSKIRKCSKGLHFLQRKYLMMSCSSVYGEMMGHVVGDCRPQVFRQRSFSSLYAFIQATCIKHLLHVYQVPSCALVMETVAKKIRNLPPLWGPSFLFIWMTSFPLS